MNNSMPPPIHRMSAQSASVGWREDIETLEPEDLSQAKRNSFAKYLCIIPASLSLAFPASSSSQFQDTEWPPNRWQEVSTTRSASYQPVVQPRDLPPDERREGLLTQEEWDIKNGRRCFLIDKQFAEGLSQEEERELQQLEEETDRHLDLVAPLPFQALERLDEIARQIEADSRA